MFSPLQASRRNRPASRERRLLDPHHLAENGDRGLRADVRPLSTGSSETTNIGCLNGSYSGLSVPVNAPGVKLPSKLLFL